jgi:YVTN family beta-propeller protein
MNGYPHKVETILLAFALAVLLSILTQGWAKEDSGFSRTNSSPLTTWTATPLSKAGSLGQPAVEVPGSVSSDQPNLNSATGSSWTPPEVYAINVPEGVQAIAFDNVTQSLYALGTNSNNITEIDAATDSIVRTIPFNANYTQYVGDMVADPQGGYVYAAISNVVVKINATTSTVADEVPMPGSAPVGGIGLSTTNDRLYVGHSSADNVIVIDAANDTVIDKIGVGLSPGGISYDPINGFVYVANFLSGSVSMINTSTDKVVGTISGFSGPLYTAVDTRNGDIYVTNGNNDNVTVVNGSTNQINKTIDLYPSGGSGPISLAYDNETGYVYVADQGSDTVSVIDGASNTVIGNVKVGGYGTNPTTVATAGPGDSVYIGNLGSGSVSVLASPITESMSPTSITAETGAVVPFTAWSTSGVPPYSPRHYSWNFGDGTWFNGTNDSVSHAYWTPGNYTVNVTVEDLGGYKAYVHAHVTVTLGPAISTPQTSRPVVDARQSVTFRTNASNGTPPYVAYQWMGLPPGCVNVETASVTCSPGQPGNYSISVTVTDANGGASLPSSPVHLRVYADPVVTLRANVTQIDAGQWVLWAASANLGYGGYQFTWAGLPPGCLGVNDSLRCQVSTQGTYSVACTVTDSNGFTVASGTVSLTVYSALSVTGLNGPGVAKVGQNVSFKVVPAGGVPPLNYTWWFGDGSSEIGGSTAFHDYSVAGNYTVRVDVSDGGNVTQSATLRISIEKPLPPDQSGSKGSPPTFLGLPEWDGIGLIGGVAAAVAVTIALIVRKIRGR